MIPVIAFWSGGKDSALMLDALREGGVYYAKRLLTTVTGDDRVSAHGVPLALVERQAEALGLPLQVLRQEAYPSNEAYEAGLRGALNVPGVSSVRTLAFGDLYLEDIRRYREALARRLRRETTFPLWGRAPADLAQEFIARGFRAIVVSVDTEQLDPSFAGRRYDEAFLEDLPSEVDPCGERGEFHTFVYDGPPFPTPISFEAGPVTEGKRFAACPLRE